MTIMLTTQNMIDIMLNETHFHREIMNAIIGNTSASSTTLGTAVVTGASAGIGRVYADRLARRGYDLILVARRGDRLDSVAATLRAAHGVAVSTIVADLADPAELEKVAAALVADKSITMLVNNAGSSTVAGLEAMSKAKMDAMNGINVLALVRLSHAIFPEFKTRDKGTLVNIGSVLALFSLPGGSLYSATKGYVQNFTRGLQEEAAGTGVTVQLVMPGATATDIWELSGVPLSHLDPAHVMTPEDLVDAALAGLDLGEAVTMPGVEDIALFEAYDAARLALAAATASGRPASRYAIGK
jgi:short-subunit dehydrogenase